MSDTQTFIVVGAGHAGGRAVEAMRMAGFEGRIVLIGDEPHLPYERPPLSKELLQGKPDAHTPVRDRAFYDDRGIECRLGRRAVAIRPDDKTVELDDGEIVVYDKLLLTTGGRVRRIDAPGADLANLFYLRTLDDSQAIDERLRDGAHVVVVGGGFIGLEVAASARSRGCAVTVLEIADRLLGRAVLPEISDAFLALHRENGVDVRLGVGISRFEGNGRIARAVTTDGNDLPADLAVVGVGILPETDLAEKAGVACDNGIVVDQYCRTSIADIFAAGDATNHFNPIHERRIRQEAWQNAQNQGVAAARIMCGDETRYAETPWMWSDQFDANLQVAGMPESWDTAVWRGDPAARDAIAFLIAGGALVGAMSLNRPSDMRMARRLIDPAKPADIAALGDDEVPLRDLVRAKS